ncbi:MAG TPA: GNAT family protein [Ktedonosporobacter sp.]|nr:GNAT family protein [Ktedonosporobacter sp.]
MSIMLRGKKIYLRPLAQADLPIFAAWSNDLEYLSEFNTFGLHWPGELAKGWQEGGLLDSRHGTLAIVTYDEQITGNVSYHQQHYGPNDGSVVYNIGIVLAPEYRGKGYGSEAQRLPADYLFATYPIMRVEASTDITNLPEWTRATARDCPYPSDPAMIHHRGHRHRASARHGPSPSDPAMIHHRGRSYRAEGVMGKRQGVWLGAIPRGCPLRRCSSPLPSTLFQEGAITNSAPNYMLYRAGCQENYRPA